MMELTNADKDSRYLWQFAGPPPRGIGPSSEQGRVCRYRPGPHQQRLDVVSFDDQKERLFEAFDAKSRLYSSLALRSPTIQKRPPHVLS